MFLDEESFKAEMEKQRERARSARTGADVVGWKGNVFAELDPSISSSFIGYDSLEATAKILAIGNEDQIVKEAIEGQELKVILDATTFYPEGGGQVGDSGIISNENFQFLVKDTKKGNNNTIIHVGKLLSGHMHINDLVKCTVDSEKRMDTARNHSATHLLHKALREVVGEHVEQAGSQVDGLRLRFDFSHFQGLTKEELDSIERIVNNKIFAPESITIKNTSIEEAKEMGAMALFGEKYGDVVRVVKMGDFSTELCGGTHLNSTAEVGTFKIVSETGVAAGVRRIEAITGRQVYNMLNRNMAMIHKISDAVKSNVTDLTAKIDVLIDENKKLSKEVDQMKSKMAASSVGELIESAIEVRGMKVIAKFISGADIDMLKTLGDNLKEKCENTIIALATETDGKALFVVMATEDAVKNGAHSGKIVKELAAITKGGGGGKPNMAQAGGKDPSRIGEALQNISLIVEKIG
jgi:alanyl-tRNA synthetase